MTTEIGTIKTSPPLDLPSFPRGQRLYLVYLDESGDDGETADEIAPWEQKNPSPTDWIVLNAVIVHESRWLETLDLLIEMRRHIQAEWGVPLRAELKGKHFADRRGGAKRRNPLKGISSRERWRMYRYIMQFEAERLNIQTFSVAVHKMSARQNNWEPLTGVWDLMIQRLNTFCTKPPHDPHEHMLLLPDEGPGAFVRKRMRAMRRHSNVRSRYGNGIFMVPTTQLLDDPADRQSQHSYFIQLADMNAWAAHRSRHIDPRETRAEGLWDQLDQGYRLVRAVNAQRGGWPPGIKVHPEGSALTKRTPAL